MEKIQFPLMEASVVSCDAYTMAKMRADTYNAMEGTLTGYDCKKCKNRGNFLVAREDGSVYSRECTCMGPRRSLRNLQQSGLQDRIQKNRFESFEATEPWQKALLARVKAYAENPEGWLLLSGQSGCGKTHLCIAVCRELLLRGEKLSYLSWRDQLPELRQNGDLEKRQKKMQGFKDAPVLYIDDFLKTGAGNSGPSRPMDWDLDLAFELINYRYNQRLLTILSSEWLPEELMGLDHAMGGRIAEMAGENLLSIRRDPKRNYRMKKITKL